MLKKTGMLPLLRLAMSLDRNPPQESKIKKGMSHTTFMIAAAIFAILATCLSLVAGMMKIKKDERSSAARDLASEQRESAANLRAVDLQARLDKSESSNRNMTLAISDQIAKTKDLETVLNRIQQSGVLPPPVSRELAESESKFKSARERLSRAPEEIPLARAAAAQKATDRAIAEENDRKLASDREEPVRKRVADALDAMVSIFKHPDALALFPDTKVTLRTISSRLVLTAAQIQEQEAQSKSERVYELLTVDLGSNVVVKVSTRGVIVAENRLGNLHLYVKTTVKEKPQETIEIEFFLEDPSGLAVGIRRGGYPGQTSDLPPSIFTLSKTYAGDELIANVISEYITALRVRQ